MKLSISILMCAGFSAPLFASEKRLEEVVVTSSRTEVSQRSVGVAVSVIDQDDIAKMGFLSLTDMLRTQPGIAVSNAGGLGKQSSVRIRGEESYRTLFVIDGIELSDPSDLQMSARSEHLLTGPEIQRVEVLRGPQGFSYGADAGGVVNMITKTAEKTEGYFRIETGSNNTRNHSAYVSASQDGSGLFLSVNGYRTDGFNTLTTDTSLEDDGYRNKTLHGKFQHQLNSHWAVKFVGRDIDATNEYDNCSFADDNFNFIPTNDCINDYQQRVVRFSADYNGGGFQHHWAISDSNVEQYRFAGGLRVGESDGSIKKLEYLTDVALSTQWNLGAGVEHKNESMETRYNPLSDRSQLGVFSELRFQTEDKLFATAGLRQDDHDIFGNHLSGRVSLAYVNELGAQGVLKYRATYGTGFRAPSLYEEAYNQSSWVKMQPLKVELTQGGDAGVEYLLTAGQQFELTYFQHNIRDEIEFDMVNYTGYLQAEGVSHSEGVELGASFPFSSQCEINLNYTYNDTLTADDQRRVRRPRHVANATLIANGLAESLQIYFHTRYSADAIDIDGKALDDYAVTDINLVYRLAGSGALSVRCENVFDKEYIEARDYNTAGRGCYAGLELNI